MIVVPRSPLRSSLVELRIFQQGDCIEDSELPRLLLLMLTGGHLGRFGKNPPKIFGKSKNDGHDCTRGLSRAAATESYNV